MESSPHPGENAAKMAQRQTRIERAAEGRFPYWVALLDEKCTGANHEKIREFCRVNGLTLSRFGAAVVWEKEWYQVFRFGRLEDADHFIREFGGERMHPSERGKGKRWAQWRKGSYRP
jgi:hypothetical protein